MNRDNIIGLIFIAIIIIGYSLWMAPSEEELAERRMREAERERIEALEAERAEEEAIQPVDTMPEPAIETEDPELLDAGEQERLRERMGHFSNAAIGQEDFFIIENEVMRLNISSRGGHIHKAELTDYKTWDQEPLILIKGLEEERFTIHFFSDDRNVSTENLYFSPYVNNRPLTDQEQLKAEGSEMQRLSMRAYTDQHTDESPSFIEFVYTLQGDAYMLDFDVRFIGTDTAINRSLTYLNLDWRAKLPRSEKNRENELNNTTVYYKYANDDVSRIRPTRDGSERLSTRVRWISFKQEFFSSTLISEEGFAEADVTSTMLGEEEEDFLKNMTASIVLPFNARQDNIYNMKWYLGPNRYRTLTQYDLQLERQIPLGWGFFLTSWINRILVIPVFNFLDGFNFNYGIIILILTILLKIVLLPIAYKTYMSQAKMRLLKPEIEELTKKFPNKEDAMKKQQATMALYKKAGVNPMAGCIPMLLQLPILISLFRFFPASIELRQESFLWADDLSSYDSILDLPFTIPFYGEHVSLFTLLMAGSMVIYTKMNSQMMSSSSQMPGMKMMMYFMPVMLLAIFNSFASGLSYYYFLANVITFAQMFLFKKVIDEDALHAKIEANKKKPVKKSKWQQRMEELAKQQEAQKKRRKK